VGRPRCTGSKYHKTPHLDRLAAAGVRFTDAYSAAPICSPTRAALVTGKHPPLAPDRLAPRPRRQAGPAARPAGHPHQPTGRRSDPRGTLKAAGYTTGHVGKWHLGGGGPDEVRVRRWAWPRAGEKPAGRLLHRLLDRRGREVHPRERGPAVLPPGYRTTPRTSRWRRSRPSWRSTRTSRCPECNRTRSTRQLSNRSMRARPAAANARRVES